MKTLVIEAEMEEVGESIIRKFLGRRKNLPRCIDIEGLIQNYLRLPMIEYAEFADKDFDEMGFLSGGHTLRRSDKLLVQKMADSVGVSFTAFFNRLKELNLIEYHSMEEYLELEMDFGREKDDAETTYPYI